jgi:hypothetical protein
MEGYERWPGTATRARCSHPKEDQQRPAMVRFKKPERSQVEMSVIDGFIEWSRRRLKTRMMKDETRKKNT